MNPLVSIAIPAYRPGPIFEETLESCLAQDYPSLEVVVALEGEDESVRAAVARAADPRVRVVSGGPRLGQFANFNRAVDASRGELVKLFSADDLMARDCLSQMAGALAAHPELGFCTARHVTFRSDATGRIAPDLAVPRPGPRDVAAWTPEAARRLLADLGNQVGGPSNVMLRRSAWWATGGFDPRVSHLGDIAYWNRLAARSGLVLVDRPLVAYRIHENSVTGRDALSPARIDDPLAICEDATLGAAFPDARWRERTRRRLRTVEATIGYALSLLRRDQVAGLRALWRLLGCGGAALLPVTLPVAAWAAVRGRLPGFGPRRLGPEAEQTVTVDAAPATARALVDLLSEPGARARLLAGGPA